MEEEAGAAVDGVAGEEAAWPGGRSRSEAGAAAAGAAGEVGGAAAGAGMGGGGRARQGMRAGRIRMDVGSTLYKCLYCGKIFESLECVKYFKPQ